MINPESFKQGGQLMMAQPAGPLGSLAIVSYRASADGTQSDQNRGHEFYNLRICDSV